MTKTEFTIFDTALGACAIAWRESGIVAVRLHEKTAERTRAALLRQFPEAMEAAPSPEIRKAIADVAALVAGEKRHITDAPLDLGAVPDFNRRVYEIAMKIPPGETMTYGAVAKAMGEAPMAARAVGVALGQNPFAPIVPCHRVVAANGKLGGFSAPGGAATKLTLLKIEGAAPAADLFDAAANEGGGR
jgi:methylated-DNA-[protein]-cysteine S-methyltransferase